MFKLDRQFLLELLIVLIVINYMVITVILHDFFPLKYSRDLILLLFTVLVIIKRKKTSIPILLYVSGIFFFLVIGFNDAFSQNLGMLVFRKYAFPLMLLIVTTSYNIVFDINRFLRFIACLMGVAAAWGVFQAYVLGDVFLRNIGYSVSYSYGYGEDMLNNSFYFGGLGIQRVVSTICNSNVCGLILGMSLILLTVLYDYWEIRFKKYLMITLSVGYVLTFSRSNFLAMGIIFIIVIWPILKRKKFVLGYGLLLILCIVVFALYQGENGILFRLFQWVDLSLRMSDSSSAGRFDIWLLALKGVVQNPFGVGLGHVGTIAISNNVPNFFTCENSYLAMALDLGWGGAVLYCTFLAFLIKKSWKIWKKNRDGENEINAKFGRVAFAVIIYHSIVMFFSNHIYDMESLSFMFVLVGVAFSFAQIKCEKNNF